MAQVIDLRGSDGQLVILGSALTLPTSNAPAFGANVTTPAGSLRFNSLQNRIEYLPLNTSAWLDIAIAPERVTEVGLIPYVLSPVEGSYVRMINVTPTTVIIPSDTTQQLPIGTRVTIVRAAVSGLTISAQSGVVINNPRPGNSLRAQFSRAVLVKVAVNTWDLDGDLV